MAQDLVVSPALVIPASELSENFSRSSGPGGQGVNTADSRVKLTFDLSRSPSIPQHLRHRMLCRLRGRLTHGALTVTAGEHRAQLQNRAAARERMARLLRDAAAAPPPTRRPTRATRGSKERRITEKKRRATIKQGRRADWGSG